MCSANTVDWITIHTLYDPVRSFSYVVLSSYSLTVCFPFVSAVIKDSHDSSCYTVVSETLEPLASEPKTTSGPHQVNIRSSSVTRLSGVTRGADHHHHHHHQRISSRRKSYKNFRTAPDDTLQEGDTRRKKNCGQIYKE